MNHSPKQSHVPAKGSEPANGTSGRIAAVEFGRVISALAIVWIHTATSEPGSEVTKLCRFGVPYFAACTVYFSAKSAISPIAPSWFSFLKSRLRRIYLPFLLWSFVYLLFRLTKHHFQPGGSPIIVGPSTLLNGTAHHLWFLPFALIVSSLGFAVGRFGKGLNTNAQTALAIGLSLLGIFCSFIPASILVDLERHPSSYFFHYAFDACPAALWAASISLFPTLRRSTSRALVFGVLSIVFLSTLFIAGYHSLLAGLSGFFVFLSALTANGLQLSRPIALAASLSFGVYAVHVLFVEGTQFCLARCGVTDSSMLDLVVFVFSICASYTFCFGVNRFRAFQAFVR